MTDIIESLKSGNVRVNFTKRDGTVRNMRCTLQSTVVPVATGAGRANTNPNVVSVWDLDKSAWRSFDKTAVNEWFVEV
jgi:hypothetical protein